MAAQGEGAVTAVEVEKVRTVVKSAFDYDYLFYGSLKKKKPDVISSRDMRVPIRIRTGGKFRHFNPDGGNYGRGSGIAYEKATINVQHLLEAVEWTDLSEWSTDDERKAVLNSFKDGLSKALEELQRNVDSICMTDGTGTLGTVTTYSVGTGTGGGDRLTLATDGFRARLVRFDMDVNIYNAALSTNRTPGAERTINFHDLANNIIDVTPSLATGIATDKVVVSGLTAAPPVSVLGIPYHHSNASSGTWLGLNRANFPEIRANRVAAGGVLSLPHARLAMNKIGDRVGIEGRKAKYTAWTHPAQAAALEEIATLVTVLNKMPDNGAVNMYYGDNMQLAGAPVKVSYSWDRTRIDFIGDAWGRAEMRAADFIKKNGKYIFEGRGTDGGVAAYNLIYPALSFNVYIDNPAEGAYIDTLTIPSGY